MDLAELVEEARETVDGKRISYMALSDMVGGAVSGETIRQLVRTKPKAFPSPATIEALVTITGYPAQTIINCAARSLGFRMVEPGKVRREDWWEG